MEEKSSRKNSHLKIEAGETFQVAEAKEAVIVIPVILEVAKVEVPVTVRVRIHVRHPVVTVSAHAVMYKLCSTPPHQAPALC